MKITPRASRANGKAPRVPLNVHYGVVVHLRSGRVLKTHPLASIAPDDLPQEKIAGYLSEQINNEIQSVKQTDQFLEVLMVAGEDGMVLVNPAEIEYVNVIVLRLVQTATEPVDQPSEADEPPGVPGGLPIAA